MIEGGSAGSVLSVPDLGQALSSGGQVSRTPWGPIVIPPGAQTFSSCSGSLQLGVCSQDWWRWEAEG